MSRLEGSLRGTLLGSSVPLPGRGNVAYAKLAADKLRLEAESMLTKWGSLEVYVRGRIADRMLEENNRSPSVAEVRSWLRRARQRYYRWGAHRTQQAAELRNRAGYLDTQTPAEGDFLRSPQETPTHRPPSSTDLPGDESEGVSS
ncbi:KRUF family protein, partial [Toxoplasma gondii GAB2-2007-GAL-DOM2]